MFEIFFKDIPIKHIHTRYGDFLYSDIIRIIMELDSEDGNDWDDEDFPYKIPDEDIKNWMIEEKVAKLINGECYRGKNLRKVYDELTEHERIMNRLIGG